jgi:hypothetical protein
MRCGWVAHPSPAIILTVSLSGTQMYSLPSDSHEEYRWLYEDDCDALCHRDVAALVSEIQDKKCPADHSIMAVLPVTELVTWLHRRADILGLKIFGRSPRYKGCMYSKKAWLYWHHDFRKQRLFIQRSRLFVEEGQVRHDILATLLLHAIIEAQSWSLPAVVLWETGPDVHEALKLLGHRLGDFAPLIEKRRRETASLRWRGGENKTCNIEPDEHYAWN